MPRHLAFSQVNDIKLQSLSFYYMSRSQSICVDVVDIVRMEDPRLLTSENTFLARWISQPVNAPFPTMSRVAFARCTHNRNALR